MQSKPVARIPGGEPVSENIGQVLFGNANARVGYSNGHKTFSGHFGGDGHNPVGRVHIFQGVHPVAD